MQVKIEQRKKSDRGGYICMPRRENIPIGKVGWKLTICPECGKECWDRPLPEGFTPEMFSGKICTMCAVKKGMA